MKRNRTLLVMTTASAAVAGVLCTFVLVPLTPVSPNVEPLRASIHRDQSPAIDPFAQTNNRKYDTYNNHKGKAEIVNTFRNDQF